MRRWLQLFVVLSALAYAGSWAASQFHSIRDRSEVAQWTKNAKTVCVGRYLVGLPAEAELSFSGGMLGGFEIGTRSEEDADFHARLDAREAQLKAGGMIEIRQLRIPDMAGRILIHGRTRSHGTGAGQTAGSEYVSVETHAHVAGLSVTLAMPYADEADIRLAETLLARLRPRKENGIPGSPGFCMGPAVFAEPLPTKDSEHVVMHGRLPRHPDLALRLFSISGAQPGPGILSRTAEVDGAVRGDELLRVTKLRAGKRRSGELEGEELLERVREYNFVTTDGFAWEVRGIHGKPPGPYLALELETGISPRPGGSPVDTSLHEDALLALWDSVVTSIRQQDSDAPLAHPAAPGRGLRQASRAGH